VLSEEFFSRPSYLTVSSQLHLEALASAISRVYTLSPCFRAERSQTNRHLAEFWMLEAEWAFTHSIDDICQVVQGAIKEVIQRANKDMTARNLLLDINCLEGPWPRISYTDAIAELEKYHTSAAKKFTFPPAWGKALQSEHERWLANELVHGPVFVTDYPTSLKPFYMRLNDDGRTVACFDLLVPRVGELVGGSLREERLSHLERALDGHGLSREEYGWYLDLRKYGTAPHGGFGLGFERLIGWLSGIENVRECIPMPRWAGRMLL
jgi:asparaginyl-tRNA synthetase